MALLKYPIIFKFLNKYPNVPIDELTRIAESVHYGLRLNGYQLEGIETASRYELIRIAKCLEIQSISYMNRKDLINVISNKYHAHLDASIADPGPVIVIPDSQQDRRLSHEIQEISLSLSIGNPVELQANDCHDLSVYECEHRTVCRDDGTIDEEMVIDFFKRVLRDLFVTVYRNLKFIGRRVWYVYQDTEWKMITDTKPVFDEYYRVVENSVLSPTHIEMFTFLDTNRSIRRCIKKKVYRETEHVVKTYSTRKKGTLNVPASFSEDSAATER